MADGCHRGQLFIDPDKELELWTRIGVPGKLVRVRVVIREKSTGPLGRYPFPYLAIGIDIDMDGEEEHRVMVRPHRTEDRLTIQTKTEEKR